MRNYHQHDPSQLTEAVVRKVYDTYVVAHATANVGDLTTTDSITFHLNDWHGSEKPQASQVIMLVNVMLYVRGWRASQAYPIAPVPVKGALKRGVSK